MLLRAARGSAAVAAARRAGEQALPPACGRLLEQLRQLHTGVVLQQQQGGQQPQPQPLWQEPQAAAQQPAPTPLVAPPPLLDVDDG